MHIEDQGPAAKGALSLGNLIWVSLKIGTMSFGGLGAALALVEQELVVRRGALTREDFIEALTYTKLLPGSTVVQVVSYVGFRLGGWFGSALATVAFVFPSAVVMTMLAILYVNVTDFPEVTAALNGLVAAVTGLLAATTIRLGQTNVKNIIHVLFVFAAFVAVFLLGVNSAVVVVAAGILGLVTDRIPAIPKSPTDEGGG
jgi:chromate transporter